MSVDQKIKSAKKKKKQWINKLEMNEKNRLFFLQ